MNDRLFSLTKLDISGPIDDETPEIVLKEIAESYDIEFDTFDGLYQTINHIANCSRRFRFHYPLKTTELIDASHLVNKNVSWDMDSLQKAIDFILLFMGEIGITSETFIYGFAIPSKPETYSPCMIYRLLQEKGIKCQRDTTFDQMAKTALVAYDDRDHIRNIILSDLLSSLPPTELAKLYLYGTGLKRERQNEEDEQSPSRQRRKISEDDLLEIDLLENDLFIDAYDDLEEIDMDIIPCLSRDPRPSFFYSPQVSFWESSYLILENNMDFFTNEDFLRQRLEPKTHAEAVILACMCYNIDLSYSQFPLAEYSRLKENPLCYVPLDPYIKSLTVKNPFILHLDVFFNPLLPEKMYEHIDLRKMALLEGYRETDFIEESYFSLLQYAYLSETFYHGKSWNIVNETIFSTFDAVEDEKSSKIVCYGCRDGPMHAFTYVELAQYFRKSRSFQNPLNNDVFGRTAIQKLKILSSMSQPGDTPEDIAEKALLKQAINHVEVLSEGTTLSIRRLYDIYISKDEDKAVITKMVWSFFRLGMYMRGWDGLSILPIINAPVLDQDMVDIRVNTEIHSLENIVSEAGEAGKLFMKVPLLKYVKGEYVPSNTIEEGLTIGERLDIVKIGDNDDEDFQEACIRLTSNWFCATAYKIMEVLDLEIPYKIQDLRYIS